MGNGLHTGVLKDLWPIATIALINKSDDVSKAGDGVGFTPLYRSIEYGGGPQARSIFNNDQRNDDTCG